MTRLLAGETYVFKTSPAFFRIILSLFVKVQGNFCVQTNSKIIVHDALFSK